MTFELGEVPFDVFLDGLGDISAPADRLLIEDIINVNLKIRKLGDLTHRGAVELLPFGLKLVKVVLRGNFASLGKFKCRLKIR